MATLGLLPESAGYIAGLSVLAAVATLAVGLRFWAMSLTRAGLHPDEWLSLVTIVTCHGLTATVFLAFVRYGLGHSTVELTEANLAVTVSLRKLSFAASLLYAVASFAVKLAVIGFYFRIFPTRITRWGCYALGGTCSVWFLVAVIVSFAACRPLGASWDPTVLGRCLDATNFPVALAALNVVVNAATVALPIYEVSKLRLARRKKYTVVGIFVIGGIAAAASLVRLIALLFTLTPRMGVDAARLSSVLSALGIIEVYVSLIGACVPTLGPIYDRFRGGRNTSTVQLHSHLWAGINSKSSKRRSKTQVKTLGRVTSRSHLRPDDDVDCSFDRLEDASISSNPAESTSYWIDTSMRAAANPSKVKDIPLRTIHLQRDTTT
ncbi:hypothetical protein F4823DRAFT_606024 [Ustulina deusta]|nr:hypothetical protein F4823DRAFT_606024 [Ustulina deusta]